MSEQQLNADQPEAHVNLGNMYAEQGKYAESEKAYREAIAVDDLWIPAYVNLAELLRKTQGDTASESVLQQGLSKIPRAAALHYALGLLKIRQKNLPSALSELQRAVQLAPQSSQFNYVYALALAESGKKDEAIQALERALKAMPHDQALNTLRAQLTQAGERVH